jgi:hypothetical protein
VCLLLIVTVWLFVTIRPAAVHVGTAD